MLREEELRGILDLVKGILGVKAQNAEIMICANGEISFRVDKSILYSIQTDMVFPGLGSVCITYADTYTPLGMMESTDLVNGYNHCIAGGRRLLIKQEDLQDDPVFAELSQLKSKDGIGYYKIMDREYQIYRIPMYTGFVKINKGDKVDIEIYDDGPYYLNKFVIKKKKINYPIQVYFLTLKLG